MSQRRIPLSSLTTPASPLAQFPFSPSARRASQQCMLLARRSIRSTSTFRRALSTMIKVGDTFPTAPSVQIKFKENHTMGSLIEGKKVLIVTLPGAFTPT